ncbi:hypothetical protein FSP39_013139 [Pinctada imbricata]|uniref:Uncharacterized protein n=1 Tax=Pinctada imbricata TaxID=66713 RepID=A0AA89BKH4_PINIB|nr:hypothetical protein FSP39_013139 [Pinctada imbricata]
MSSLTQLTKTSYMTSLMTSSRASSTSLTTTISSSSLTSTASSTTGNENQNVPNDGINTLTIKDDALSLLNSSMSTFDICEAKNDVYKKSKGYIHSPKFQDQMNYPYNRDCAIRLITDPQKRFHLEFEHFDVEYHTSCSWDSVMIYDGPDISSSLVLKACGNNIPGNVTASGPIVVVRFISDHVVNRRGFKIKFKTIKASLQPETSPIYTTSKSPSSTPVITTPLLPSSTNHTSTSPTTIFKTTDSPHSVIPKDVVMDTRLFRIDIENTPYLNISSPGYTEGMNYPTSLQSQLTILNHYNKTLHIEITFLQLEFHVTCAWDSLTLYGGLTKSSNLVGRLCGKIYTPKIYTVNSSLVIHFKSDSIIPDRGFSLTINSEHSSTRPPSSSSITTLSTKTTSIPILTTTATPKTSTTMTTTRPKPLFPSTTSAHQTVSMSTTTTGLNSASLSTNQDSSETATTRKTTTTTTMLPLECSGVSAQLTSPYGFVTSPGFDDGKMYPSNIECSWVIGANSGMVVEMNFEHLDLEPSTDCKWDSVTIYDGLSSNETVLGTFCGSSTPDTLTSSTNGGVFIYFKTDRVIEKTGFKLAFTEKYITLPTPDPVTCSLGQSTCAAGQCIQSEWMCDGEIDCPGGDDEVNCGQCPNDQFRCMNGQCVPIIFKCDGKTDCSDGSDEKQCLRFKNTSDELQVLYSGKWLPVCTKDTWSHNISNSICKKLSYSSVRNVSSSLSNNLLFMTLRNDANDDLAEDKLTNLRSLFEPSTYCPGHQAVHVSCMNNNCGRRSTSLISPYIIGGSISYAGQWPWMVAIKSGVNFLCGGALVSEFWVVTAAHCIESVHLTPQFITVVTGSVFWNTQTADNEIRVVHIVIHPEHSFIYNADIALLRLQKKVIFNDLVRPLCLDHMFGEVNQHSLCYTSGWGVISMSNFHSTELPSTLRHAKMRIWSHSKCRNSYGSKIKDTMLCAGYHFGEIDTCKGDSGGPLMCKVHDNRWVLAGVTSWGETPCGQMNKPGVYTSVKHYNAWINDVTAPVEEAINCTFEDTNICMYQDISTTSFMWIRAQGGVSTSMKPTKDNTYKNESGHYLYTEVPYVGKETDKAVLLLPGNKSIDTIKCLKFAVMFVGTSNIVLEVVAFVDGKDSVLWKMSAGILNWHSTGVTLQRNSTNVRIIATQGVHSHSGVAIDDIKLLDGECPSSSKHSCDFNGGHFCSFRQSTDDVYDWIILQTNQSYKNDLSACLTAESKETNTKVKILSPTISTSLPLCLKFRYQMCIKGELSVQTNVEFDQHVIFLGSVWKEKWIIDTCSSWVYESLTLPARTYNYSITFEGSILGKTGKMCIDDVAILNGDCLT